MENKSKRISFSELKTWSECSYKHKLRYIDNLSEFSGNEYTAFGTAIHYLCEKKVIDHQVDDSKLFSDKFEEEVSKVVVSNPKNVLEMRNQHTQIAKDLLSSLSDQFGDYEVHSVEEELFEPLNLEVDSEKTHFKGFVDLIIKTEDEKYHIIDWKSCSWGWNREKKSDKVLSYQLMLYKKYFSEKYTIDPSKIETYFGLLKRTANKNSVEIFRVTSGKIKMKRCIDLLEMALKNIEKSRYIKNRLSCKYCEFYKTAHCT
jgi:ATP-dependent exoDNAse (exonuclease V) beta subunit